MKQIYILLSFLILSTIGLGQCLSEDFTNLSLSSYTSGTFVINDLTWSGTQVFQETSSASFGGTGKAIRINDDKAGANLTTPAVDAPQSITFDYRELNSGGGTFIVQKSTDGGTTFTDICTQAFSGTTYQSYSCDINEASSNVQIRILNDDNAGHLIIDNISVVCSTTTTCAISNITATPVCNGDNADVTVTFDSANASGTYEYSIDDTNFSAITNNGTFTVTGPTNGESYTLTIRDTVDNTCSANTTFTVPTCPEIPSCFDLSAGSELFEIVTPTTNTDNDMWIYNSDTQKYSANGFLGVGNYEAIDTWLIFGPLDMTGTTDLHLQFDATESYGSTDLLVKYTSDYSSLCPTTATWTTAATISTEGSQNIDLSAATGTAVYFAIQYQDLDEDGYSLWSLSNVSLTSTTDTCPTLGTRPTSECVATCNITDAGLTDISCSNLLNDEADSFDDAIAFTINPEGVGLGATGYTITSSVAFQNTQGTYGINQTFTAQPGSAGSGDLQVTITDNDNTDCSFTFTVTDPGLCIDQPVTVSNNILITEVADPKDVYQNRFVEICNRGDQAVDISGWALKRYSNGSVTSGGSVVIASNTVLQPGDCYVMTTTQATYTDLSCQNVESGQISGNGDDVYELVDIAETTVDIYGVIGVDGTGEAWEYEDAIATRNADITEGNTTWTASEWTINTDANTVDASPCQDELAIYEGIVDNCVNSISGTPVSGSEFTYIMVDNKVIAAINPNGNDLGEVSGSVYISSTPREDANETNYINRTIFLTPQNNLAATVRYYFTQAEFDALVTDSNNDNDTGDEVNVTSDLHVTKVDGASCSAGIGTGIVSIIEKTAITEGSDDIGLYLEFDITGFSSFTAHGGDPIALPVKLIEFTGYADNHTSVLEWTTASEVNNDYFAIERSVDGITFEQIGVVNGAGDSNTVINYSFIDNAPNNDINYYRLNQVDFDGASEYSDVIAVMVSSNILEFVAANKTKVFIQSVNSNTATLKVYNIQGQLIDQIEQDLVLGLNEISLNNLLYQGVYIIYLEQEDNIISKKFIIQ